MSAWYERPRIFYDWARYGEALDAGYVRHVVQKAVDVHADTLAFCAVLGGYALWPSDVTPRYEHARGLDLIGEMARLCAERDLRFVPWWLATASGGTACWLERHPDWRLVGPPRDDGTQAQQNYICYNTPYRDILYGEVREVLSRYDVDGIYFDQLPGSCYCPTCRQKFEASFGEPMPVVADEFFVYNSPAGLPAKLRDFRDDCVRDFCAGMRAIVDAARPETCYAQNWVRGVQAHLAAGYADVLLPEFYQRQDLVPLGLRMRLTKAYFDDGPIWGNVRHGVRHDARHFPVDPTRMLLMDCVASRAAPLMLDLCAMDFDATGTPELAATFDDMGVVLDRLAPAAPVPYAALLHSRASHLADRDRFEAAFEGLYRLLFEHHVPFEIVTEEQVCSGALDGVPVLVLADAFALRDETVTALHEAADQGTGLIATYTTGMADGHGAIRRAPALADLLGVRVGEVIAPERSDWARLDPLVGRDMDGGPFGYGCARAEAMADDVATAGLFSFQGGRVVCEALEGASVWADIHEPDVDRLAAPAVNRRGLFPGAPASPFLVTRERGATRTAYIAGQVEAEGRRAHGPQIDALLMAALRWVGGRVPVEAIDCPRSVEVRLFHDPATRQLHVLLVNLTTNPLIPSSAGPAVVRYVSPQRGIRLRLDTPAAATRVASAFGSQLVTSVADDHIIVELEGLYLYDCISVDYGATAAARQAGG